MLYSNTYTVFVIYRYVDVTKSRNKHNNITVLHHYKADVFNVAIDQQLVELNDRFSVQTTELMTLCASWIQGMTYFHNKDLQACGRILSSEFFQSRASSPGVTTSTLSARCLQPSRAEFFVITG